MESILQEFMRYHEDYNNYRRNPSAFDEVYEILDKYDPDLNKDVGDVFVKATPEDQQLMIDLIRP